MGVEHSKGTQKLCYINAHKEEECFRNEYETHNVFEMGFDIIQKDIVDPNHHAERHHEFTADPRQFHDFNIDPELLHQYGIEPEHLDKLAEQFHEQHHDDDAFLGGDPIYGHGLDQLHKYIHEKTAEHHQSRKQHIEDDFAHKLIGYKTKQTGNEYRLFGHTMVGYDQLSGNVKHNQCVQLAAHHQFHIESGSKWLCQPDLDAFWDGECVNMEPRLEMCNEDAIALFLGKCTEVEGFEICPSDPIVVENMQRHIPEGCHLNKHDKVMCPHDLYGAFKHGSCFRVGTQYICEDDMESVIQHMCLRLQDPHNNLTQHAVCNEDLYGLFHGEHIQVDGSHYQAELSTPQVNHSDMCRDHQGVEFCKSHLDELYATPHDCVMLLGDWHCRDQMHESWKSGCIDVGPYHACGADMVDVVLQGCVELGPNDEWVCPSAVGTKHGGYSNE